MTCPHFDELSAYLDDAVDQEASAALEAHLFRCPDCRHDYRALRARSQKLAALEPPLPPTLDDFVLNAAANFLDTPHAPSPRATRETWRGVAAAAMVCLAVLAMGIFALRAGGARPLSTLEQHTEGLSRFGNVALRAHWDLANDQLSAAVESPHVLELMLGKRLTQRVHLPRTPLGGPLDARVLSLAGEPVAMADYRFLDIPTTLFVLPMSRAIDLLDLRFPDENDAVCTMQVVHRCVEVDLGTSFCLHSRGDDVQIWIAQLPATTLEKVIRAQP